MYTLVLMSAMAGGPDATRFDGWGGGCYGSACYGSCTGSACYGSCYGSASSCYGSCYGSPLFPRARAFLSGVGQGLRGAFAPLGTYRSWGCCGGYTSCSGCCGGYASCSGCTGSCTGCFGSCHGCFGGTYYGSAVYGGCYGSSVAVGCHGGCVGYSAATLPSIPAVSVGVVAPSETVSFKPPAIDSTAASLTVSLPAAAKLYVDGQLVAGDGPSRKFHTPPLTAGQTFYYELKAEVLLGGKVESEETKVVVRAGDTKDVSFGRLTTIASPGNSLAAR